MRALLSNNRFYILIFSGILAIGSYFYFMETISSSQLQIIRLTQIYAFFAVLYLYLAMLVGPLSRFINGPFIQNWLQARRGLGVSAFFFALLHASFAFFGQLGGFGGLPFLSSHYLLGISLSFTALLILTVMASSSFDWIVSKMKFKKWKWLHRLVYLAGIFILIHALLLGTHFHDLSEDIPFILFFAVTLLLMLHVKSWERRLSPMFLFVPRFGFVSMFFLLVITSFHFIYMSPQTNTGGSSFSVHNQHTGSNVTGLTGNKNNKNGLYMPGMEGDRAKRFNTELIYSNPVVVNNNLKMDFKITDASNGDPVYFFQTPFEKPFHMIVVNSDLSYFSHIHPVQQKNVFSIETSFPNNGFYHIYSDFQPFGAVEQQNGFQVMVGGNESTTSAEVVNFGLEKIVGDYIVRLQYESLTSEKLTVGDQELRFSVYDKSNKQGFSSNAPVTNLYPYLGAFGHLVMIKKDTFEYVHAHPVMNRPVGANERSGPEVKFVPMAIYGKVSPGIYKVFGQFNPNGTLITAGFWIEVK